MLQRMIDKYKSLSPILKASFFFVLCGVMKDAVDILTTPIFTRLLSQDEYGLFSVYNSYYQVLRIVVSLYIFGDGFNVGMARYSDDSEAFTSATQGFATTLFLFWSVVFFVGRRWLIQLTQMDCLLLWIMLLQTLFSTSMNSWQQKKKYFYDYQIVSIVVISYLILQPLLGIILIRLNPGQWNNGRLRIYAGVGVQIFWGFILYVVQFIHKPVFFNKTYWLFTLRTNVPILPHYLSQIILNHADRLMIDRFVGKRETAIYTIGHAAAFTLFAFTSNVNSTFVPWLYRALKTQRAKEIHRVVILLLLLCAFPAFVLVLIAPEAIAILGGTNYVDSIWVVPPLVFGVFLTFIYSIFADIELYYEKTKYVLISSLVGTVSNIMLNLVFIPKYGFYAAGYTTVAGFFLMTLIHYFFLSKTCNANQIQILEMIPLPMICFITVGLAILSGLAMLLYPFAVVRYFLMVLATVIIVLQKNRLVEIYKRLKNEEE